MPSDLANGILLDDIIKVEGVGDIKLYFDENTKDIRDSIFEGLKDSRGILSPELVDIADPIAIFYIITKTQGYFDASKLQQVINKRDNSVSKEVATEAVARAQRYYLEAARSASYEALTIAIINSIFKSYLHPVTRRPVVEGADGIILPEIPAEYWDDSKINEERELYQRPPLLPKNPENAAEKKLAYWAAIAANHPEAAEQMKAVLRSNIVAEMMQQLAENAQDKGNTAVDPETGFQSGATDTLLHDESKIDAENLPEENTVNGDAADTVS